jgi:hypothetical protein
MKPPALPVPSGRAAGPSRESPAIVLTRQPLVRRLLARRGLNWLLMLLALPGLLVAILTGLLGSATGSANFGIVFVWIVWWGLLMVVLLPLGGRLWCLVCPVPAPGEWLQRGALVAPPDVHGIRGPQSGNGASPRRWPKALRGIWLQNGAFLAVALFSAPIFTRPRVSALVLLLFLAAGVGLAAVYDRRTFCRYVCPLGGFIGVYSLAAPLALRVREPDVCRDHRTKDCYVGSPAGYGCPWLERPWQMERNAYCGLCGECFRTCPKDNVELLLKVPGGDLVAPRDWRADEAGKAFILLACAAIYPIVLLGPWGRLKAWAGLETWSGFAGYAAAFLLLCLVVLPGAHLGVAAIVRRAAGLDVPLRRLFIALAYPLVPLGLAAWVAFTLAFVFANASYALPVLSDPFGWGWDLFGTRGVPWRPLFTAWVPTLQAAILIAGLMASIRTAHGVLRTAAPAEAGVRGLGLTAAALTAEALFFLWLYLGTPA